MTRFKSPFAPLAASCLLVLSIAAQAMPFSGIVVFGDSLSDNGNLFAVSGGVQPPAPYFNGRFSNGPVGVEYMASALSVGLVDYAQGGAKTGMDNLANYPPQPIPRAQGITSQYLNYIGSHSLAPAALYVVWGGPNDFLSGSVDVAASLSNLGTVIRGLAAHGAREILVPNMPNLGLTPRVGDPTGPANLLTLAFDAALADLLHNLGTLFPETKFLGFDTYSLVQGLLANAADFGFTNTTTPCMADPACLADPQIQEHYMFWDDIHPTTRVHAIIGGAFVTALPEPGGLALLALGLSGFAVRRRITN